LNSKQDALRSFSEEGPFVKYVYLLESVGTPNARYVGMTSDLKRRLAEHKIVSQAVV
jgi:predicted GIY-YIG superfamily endonuclease